MYCPNCGNSLEAVSKFCSKCGTPAANDSVPVTSQPTYSFVVTGEIVDGQSLDAVKDNLEKFIKLDRKTLDRIFIKKNVVVKKDIAKETAEKYVKAFTKCGAICKITENVTSISTNDKSAASSTRPHQAKSDLSETESSENNSESTTNKDTHSNIRLWNPNAAASWSILFTPIFGAYLHSKNWAALGNKKKEEQSMYWAYGAAGVLFISIFLPGTFGQMLSIGYLLGWYFSTAKVQVKHVKEELDDNYEKNNWLKPIGVASSCLFALWFVFSIAASMQDYPAQPKLSSLATETHSSNSLIGTWRCQTTNPNNTTSEETFSFGDDDTLHIKTEDLTLTGSYARNNSVVEMLITHISSIGKADASMSGEINSLTENKLSIKTVTSNGSSRQSTCKLIDKVVSKISNETPIEEGDIITKYISNLADQLRSTGITVCAIYAGHLDSVANSGSPDIIREKQADKILDSAYKKGCY